MAVTGRQKLKWYFAFIQPINESANPVQTIANSRAVSDVSIPDSSAKRVTAVQPTRTLTFWPVIRVATGNFLEMYDFQVFGYYAAAIARTFFPSGNEFASLMLSLMTFGAGFLMRPLGAIVLGAYMDHRGRRDGLLLTLGLMAIGTASIACTPSYASIGLIASPADFHVSVQSGDQACRPTTCAPES